MTVRYRVSVSDYAEFTAEEALQRTLARGLDCRLPHHIRTTEDWSEVRLSVQRVGRSAPCLPSELWFCQLIAEATATAGVPLGSTPIEQHFKGKLFSNKLVFYPLSFAEISFDPAQPDTITALLLLPREWAVGLSDMRSFDAHTEPGNVQPIMDPAARARRWRRRKSEIRVVSAKRQLVRKKTWLRYVGGARKRGGKNLPLKVVRGLGHHNGALYVCAGISAENTHGPVRIDSKGNGAEVPLSNKPAYIRSLCADGDTLWVGADELYQLQAGQCTARFNKRAGLPGKGIQAMACAGDGRLLVGTETGYAVLKDGAIIESVRKGLASREVACVAWMTNGDLWVGGYNGVTRRNRDGSMDLIRTRSYPSGATKIVGLPDGSALIGMSLPEPQTFRVAPGSTDLTLMPVISESGMVLAGFTHDGAQWLVTSEGRILRLREGRPPLVFTFDNTASPLEGATLIDGAVWLYGWETTSISLQTLTHPEHQ